MTIDAELRQPLQLIRANMKKIVLKVIIMCNKCKVCIMKTISKFSGIISIALDVEKSTVTIVGEVDAVLIVKELRKAGKMVEIASVGPHKKEDDKKDEKKKCKPLPPCCSTCKPVGYGNVVWYEDSNVCTIL